LALAGRGRLVEILFRRVPFSKLGGGSDSALIKRSQVEVLEDEAMGPLAEPAGRVTGRCFLSLESLSGFGVGREGVELLFLGLITRGLRLRSSLGNVLDEGGRPEGLVGSSLAARLPSSLDGRGMVDPAEDRVSERSDSSSVKVITRVGKGSPDWLTDSRLALFSGGYGVRWARG